MNTEQGYSTVSMEGESLPSLSVHKNCMENLKCFGWLKRQTSLNQGLLASMTF